MTGNKIKGNGNGAGGRGSEMPRIAIVGMAAMFPGEGGTTGFWRTITRGEDTIGEVPSHYWRSKTTTTRTLPRRTRPTASAAASSTRSPSTPSSSASRHR